MIEVMLLPDCCYGDECPPSDLISDPVIKQDALLLERWTLQAVPRQYDTHHFKDGECKKMSILLFFVTYTVLFYYTRSIISLLTLMFGFADEESS